MNKALGWALGIVVVVIVAGLFVYKATAPQPVVAPTELPVISDQPYGDFSQTAPTLAPGAADQVTDEYASVSPSASTSPAVAGARVEITDVGFAPATRTVTSGTTVTFVNNGQASHEPASDPHPTHTGLPGFDAKRPLATGDTYSFTFTKVGSFGYHDHLNPTLKGTIVVK